MLHKLRYRLYINIIEAVFCLVFKCLLISAQCLCDVLFCSVLFCSAGLQLRQERESTVEQNAYKSGYIGVDLFAEVQDAKCRV